MREVNLGYCEDGCEELDNLSPPEQQHLSVCRSQVILSSVNHVPAEHSTSLARESTAPTAPWAPTAFSSLTQQPLEMRVWLLLIHPRASGVALDRSWQLLYAPAFSDYSLSLFPSGSIRTPRFQSQGNPSAGNNINVLHLQRQT